MDQILVFIGGVLFAAAGIIANVLTFIAAVIAFILIAFIVAIIIVVDLIIKGLTALYPIALKVLATLAPAALILFVAWIAGTIAFYAILSAAIGLYHLVTYLVDTIIINPTQNYYNKDLSFLYKNKNISIFKFLFMTRFDRGKINKYMQSDIIKAFFKEKRISLNDVLELEKEERFWTEINDLFKNFKEKNINDLFVKNKLTFKQAVYATSYTCKSLQSEYILKAFENNEIDFHTLEDRKTFSHEAIDALSNSNIKSLLEENNLNLETYLSLNTNTIEALQVENICNLYKEAKITIDDFRNIVEKEITALGNKNIYDLIKNNHITFENFSKCQPNAIKALYLDCLATMFKKGKINLNNINKTQYSTVKFLSNINAAQLFLDEHITFEQIQSLEPSKISELIKLISNKQILKLLKEEGLTLDHLSKGLHDISKLEYLGKQLIICLTSDNAYQLFKDNIITFEQLIRLNENALTFINKNNGSIFTKKFSSEDISALEKLSNDTIARLVNHNLMTFDQLKLLTTDIIKALEKDYILKLFRAQKITFEHLRQYTLEDLKSLEHKNIQHLFKTYKLSIENIKLCSHDYFLQALLTIRFVMDSIVHHDNTFADLLKIKHYDMSMHTNATNRNFLEYLGRLEHIQNFNKEPSILRQVIDEFNKQVEELLTDTNNINLPQSSHTYSTEEAFSSFVIQLKNRYIHTYVNDFIHDQIRKLNELLTRYKKHSKSKSTDLEKEQVLIQNLYRFDKNVFHETKSDSSLQMLLALTYKAAQANQLDIEQYAKLMYEAFFEIRRGDNLDVNGVDDGQEDKNICPRGAFNKILEKMVGFLPGCEMIVVTPESVTQKLIALLRGKIKAFVQGNIQELLTMHIDNRKNYIFDSIQDETLNELKEEFGEKNAKPGIESYPFFKESHEKLHKLISEEINKHPQEPPIQRLEENGLFANQDNNNDESKAWMEFNGID